MAVTKTFQSLSNLSQEEKEQEEECLRMAIKGFLEVPLRYKHTQTHTRKADEREDMRGKEREDRNNVGQG